MLYFVRTDHIGRPAFATDGTGAKVWEVSYLPFGQVQVSTGTPIALRFPGQWFQAESGLYQNWMRDYDPTTGRYLQADPLGLVDGPSVYGYALQNPGRYVDPRGEGVIALAPIVGYIWGLITGGTTAAGTGASLTGVAVGAGILAIVPSTTGDGTLKGEDAQSDAIANGEMCPLPPQDDCGRKYVECQGTTIGRLPGSVFNESRCQSCYNACRHSGVWPRTIPSADHGALLCEPRKKRY